MTFGNKVSWVIEPDRCALLIHDMHPYYLGTVPANRRAELVSNVRAIGTTCAGLGIPIFASHVPRARERRESGLMRDMWGEESVAGGHDLDPGIGLPKGVVRPLTKRSYSAFYGNDFELMLRRLGRDALIIVGVYTSIGCHLSAADAFMRDIRAFLICDAMGDVDPSDHSACLLHIARTCGRVIDTQTTLTMLKHPGLTMREHPGNADHHTLLEHPVRAKVQIPLTPRQRECLVLMAHGKSDWEIGKILGISEQTAHGHIEIIKARYGCRKRIQVIVKAIFDGALALNDLI